MRRGRVSFSLPRAFVTGRLNLCNRPLKSWPCVCYYGVSDVYCLMEGVLERGKNGDEVTKGKEERKIMM